MTGLVSVSVRMVAAAATALALVLVLACGSDEEVVPAPSSTPTADNSTPAVTQEGRLLQFGEATLRYPADWYGELGGSVYSSDPAKWPSVCPPPSEVVIAASVLPSEESPRPKGAVDYRLGTNTGWELVEKNTEGCVGRRAHTVALESKNLIYTVIFNSDSEEQEPLFQDVLSTLQLPAGG